MANTITVENAVAGDAGWNNLTSHNDAVLAAFGDQISLPIGKTLNVYVASTAPGCSYDVYRMGWYNGLGGRKMQPTTAFVATNKLAATTLDATFSQGGAVGVAKNLLTCQYDFGFSIPIPTSWPSGLYYVRVYQSNGNAPTWVPFIVTNPKSTAQILFMFNDTTWQAYNAFGTYSIYSTPAAVQVSYDRPFQISGGSGPWTWEHPFVRWLERNGYDVTYCACKDLETDPLLLRKHQVLIMGGHAEYWTKTMFNRIRSARDHGTSLGFFCANTAYKRHRWLNSPQGTGAYRVLENYASYPQADPYRTPSDMATEPQTVGDWPNALAGVGYGYLCDGVEPASLFPFVCADGSLWPFAGTGMTTNDTIARIIGYEADCLLPAVFPAPQASPTGIQTIGLHTVTSNSLAKTTHTTYYQHASGAGVFGAGTINWPRGLDTFTLPSNTPVDYTDTRLKQITANVLARLIATGRVSAS